MILTGGQQNISLCCTMSSLALRLPYAAQIPCCRTRSGSSLEWRSLISSPARKLHSFCLCGLVYVTEQQEALMYVFAGVFDSRNYLKTCFIVRKSCNRSNNQKGGTSLPRLVYHGKVCLGSI